LNLGLAYPSAYANAIQEIFSDRAQLPSTFDVSKPNNTLGLFYCLALTRLNSNIQPFTIPRFASGYNDTVASHASIASATTIRQSLLQGENIAAYVPASTSHILDRVMQAQGPLTWDHFFPAVMHQLATLSLAQLRLIEDVREGLEYRLKQAIYELKDYSFAGLMAVLQTKRYTKTHIQRVLVNVLLHRTKHESMATASKDRLNQNQNQNQNQMPLDSPYIRILGFTERGQQLLKQMRKTAKAPILSRVSQSDFQLLEQDMRASYVHTLAYTHPTPEQLRRVYSQSPIFVKA
jgi:predicted nucleotidyltransferase